MQGHSVLVVDSLSVDVVPVIVIEIHRWDPFLFLRDNHPPDTAETVEVDDQEKDELVQFEEGFEFFCRPQVCDNLAEPQNTNKF